MYQWESYCIYRREMEDNYKSLVQNFRVSIRRRQINRLFEHNRASLLDSQLLESRNLLAASLADRQARAKWIQERALKLIGQPSAEWKATLMQIFHSIRAFESEHSEWMSLGIVKSICSLLSPVYAPLELSSIASSILTDLFYLNHMADPMLIQQAFSYGFIDNLIITLHSNFEVQHLRLMGAICKIAPDWRDYFGNRGCLDVAIQHIVQSGPGNSILVSAGLYYLKTMASGLKVDEDTLLFPKKFTVVKIINVLGAELERPHTVTNICLILDVLQEIASLQKASLYTHLFSRPGLVQKVIELLSLQNNGNLDIKRWSSTLIGKLLLSEDPEHSQILLDSGLLDIIQDIGTSAMANDLLLYSLLFLLSNLTADQQFAKTAVLNHPVFREFVLVAATSAPQIIVRREAIYVICNFLHCLPQQWSHILLGQMGILDVLMSAMKDMRDPKMVSEIVGALSALVISQGRDFIGMLERFDVEETLGDMEEEGLQQCIWEFLDLLQESK